jgi:iron complex transport system permease protein
VTNCTHEARARLLIVGLAGVLTALAIAALCIGAVEIPLQQIFGALAGHGLDARFEVVLWQLRLPRVLLGLLVGATLSVAGALIQGLFRNPLADSGLIGVSSGAALGAVFIIVLGAVFLPGVGALRSVALLPVAAFLGALVVTLFIQRLAATSDYTSVATLLLAGVAVNALVDAMIGLSTFFATDAQLRTLAFWTLGSLGSTDWKIVGIVTPIALD